MLYSVYQDGKETVIQLKKHKSCLINVHTHTDTSNIRLLDSTNSVNSLLETAVKMNYGGIAITDHESVSAHVSAIQTVRKMKEKGTMPADFKLILGNEIYLVDSLEEVQDNYQSGVTKFPHFLLLSRNKTGHEQLRILSSRAWDRAFLTGMMWRTPTLKSDIEEIIKPNQGHIIAGSACLGSEVNIRLLGIKEANENNDQQSLQEHRTKLNEFILWCIDVFGRDFFFIELQPALSDEQIYCNKELIKIANHYGLKMIITTDAHYARPEDRPIHEAFLNAKDGDREVASFYEACFLQSVDEIYERMDYIDTKIIDEAISNTQLIGDMVEDYTIEHDTVIPKITLPEFEVRHVFKPAYEQYKYIKKMAYSDDEQNRYIVKLVEDGFYDKIYSKNLTQERFHAILNRVNVELGELWEISEAINQTMSSYYITVAKICDIIWADDGGNSIIGSGRGSAAGFLLNYLIGITQINPLDYEVEMPHWRHLHRSRPDVGQLDIDIDTEASKRSQIIDALKRYFGEDQVLQVSTFGTETSKAAINTACRGLGYDSDIAQHLGSLIPFERGKNWSIVDTLYGNEEKGRKPVREFVNEIEKYPQLKETALGLNGLISRRGIHAGGVIIFNEVFYKSNSMMRAPNGTPTTAYDLDDSQALGNIKFDLLTVEAVDKIRVTLDLLIEHDEIEPEPTLRKTFDRYLHPDVIDKESEEVYEILGNDSVTDVFQFSTDIARDAIKKVKPRNLTETASINSIMRLMSESGEQPIDTFVRLKNNVSEWYQEMVEYGLNEDEIEVMEEHLLKLNGISDTQESIMTISMDKRIAGFSVQDANRLRKIIAGSQQDAVANMRKQFMSSGLELGSRKEILTYVWDVQVARQLEYSFSTLHVVAYTLMALQEINLNLRYNPIYWQTACLTVNSGSLEAGEGFETGNQSTNYGKIAAAIAEIQKRKIKISLPDINKAQFGFAPNIKENSILFGIKGINGIGDDVVHEIINNRPYSSFKDFLKRLYDTKTIKNSHMIQLIKAGSFESFGDRISIMKEYADHIFEPRKKLTLASFNTIIDLPSVVPEDLSIHIRFYRFRNYIFRNPIGKSKDRKTKNRLFSLDQISFEFLLEHFSEDSVVDYDDYGMPIIAEYLFDKEYDKKMQVVKDWLAEDSTLNTVNERLYQQEWERLAGNENIPQWEMSSLSYYYTAHELAQVDKEKYNLVDFYELPEEPVVLKEYQWGGRTRYEYQTHTLAGTVLDKNKNRHTVTLLTIDGVVTVKFYSGNYSFYDRQLSEQGADGKKTVVERSWFTRGQLLMLHGFRRGNQFVPRRYRDSIVQHSVMKIDEVEENGELIITAERSEVE